MSDVVIRAERLGKRYTIRGPGGDARYAATLRETVAQRGTGLVRTATRILGGRHTARQDVADDLWALRDVSFELRQGEAVGVIGRNGAGKSTLLKILSRITGPSAGRVTVCGRVASLLEVGTGFHPELTGRENVFLNGAILGMTRAGIQRRFDEIVAFAGVERFLDTPVKRYSSGMEVRLAFAVAAHLEPEVLVVDEVLAVGDAEFRRRCLGKMEGVAREGRSVLFVSHNMAAVARLCPRAMLLDDGRIVADGPSRDTIEQYLRAGEGDSEGARRFPGRPGRPTIRGVTVDRAALPARDLVVDIEFEAPEPIGAPVGGLVLRGAFGDAVWGSNANFHPANHLEERVARGVLRCVCRGLPVVAGDYTLSVWLSDWQEDFDWQLDILRVRLGRESDTELGRPETGNGYLDWPAVWHTLAPRDA